MRPCERCGHPLQNHQKTCDVCQAKQTLALGSKNRLTDDAAASPRSLTKLLGHAFWFVAELLLRTTLIGIPLSAALSLVAFFLVWNSTSLLIGTIAGMTLALGYSLIEMYFEHQAYRRPLG